MINETPNPCPFHNDDLTVGCLPIADEFQAACGCGARGPMMPTKAEAIAAWNGAGGWISVEERLPKSTEAIAAWNGAGGWISVEERLPKSTGYDDDLGSKLYPWVDMLRPGYDVQYAIGAYDKEHEEWFYSDYSDTGIDGVTHWRPLPAPPEPE
jgi:hypothetical protein